MSTAIAPHMRIDPTLAARLLAVARRDLLDAQQAALAAADPGAARRAGATAEHLRNRVSLLRARLGTGRA